MEKKSKRLNPKYVTVGKILAPHGIRGELRVLWLKDAAPACTGAAYIMMQFCLPNHSQWLCVFRLCYGGKDAFQEVGLGECPFRRHLLICYRSRYSHNLIAL